MSRIKRHFTLAGITVLTVAVFSQILGTNDAIFILSMSTAYTGMILIAVTLILGPLNIIRNRANPVSSHIRRDIGIWAGLVSIAHVVFGLQRHFGGEFWHYFIKVSEQGNGFSVRFDIFGLANHFGLVSTLICIALLALSNNASLKKLGAVQWKNIQRFNYLFFVSVIGHGFLFQFSVNRPLPFVMVVGLIFIVVISSQWKGYKLLASR